MALKQHAETAQKMLHANISIHLPMTVSNAVRMSGARTSNGIALALNGAMRRTLAGRNGKSESAKPNRL